MYAAPTLGKSKLLILDRLFKSRRNLDHLLCEISKVGALKTKEIKPDEDMVELNIDFENKDVAGYYGSQIDRIENTYEDFITGEHDKWYTQVITCFDKYSIPLNSSYGGDLVSLFLYKAGEYGLARNSDTAQRRHHCYFMHIPTTTGGYPPKLISCEYIVLREGGRILYSVEKLFYITFREETLPPLSRRKKEVIEARLVEEAVRDPNVLEPKISSKNLVISEENICPWQSVEEILKYCPRVSELSYTIFQGSSLKSIHPYYSYYPWKEVNISKKYKKYNSNPVIFSNNFTNYSITHLRNTILYSVLPGDWLIEIQNYLLSALDFITSDRAYVKGKPRRGYSFTVKDPISGEPMAYFKEEIANIEHTLFVIRVEIARRKSEIEILDISPAPYVMMARPRRKS